MADIFDYFELFTQSYRPSTKIGAKLTLGSWLDFLEEKDPFKVEPVQGHLFYSQLLKRRGIPARYTKDVTPAQSTYVHKLNFLKRFYNFMKTIDPNVWNPFLTLAVKEKGYKQKRPHRNIPADKVAAILAVPDINTIDGLTDHVWLSLLFAGGLRVGEVRNLCLFDIKQDTIILRATKNGDDVELPLADWVWPSLNALKQVRLVESGENSKLIVTRVKGIAQENRGYYSFLRDFRMYCSKVGLDPDHSPHDARHTAITKLLTEGFNYRQVQEFSRHSSVVMVERYDRRIIRKEDHPSFSLKYSA